MSRWKPGRLSAARPGLEVEIFIYEAETVILGVAGDGLSLSVRREALALLLGRLSHVRDGPPPRRRLSVVAVQRDHVCRVGANNRRTTRRTPHARAPSVGDTDRISAASRCCRSAHDAAVDATGYVRWSAPYLLCRHEPPICETSGFEGGRRQEAAVRVGMRVASRIGQSQGIGRKSRPSGPGNFADIFIYA